MRYLPHTDAEVAEMLARIGAPSIEALFEPIPPDGRLGRPLALEPALDEASLMRHLAELAAKNRAAAMLSFAGGGMYDHHVPPAVDQLLLRSEFYTAYTPYQPELSQGTLQAIFEFQTLVCELFGLEVANASMYDGASATAEAVLMARRTTRRTRAVLAAGIHPDYVAAIRSYLAGLDGTPDLAIAPLAADGRTDLGALAELVTPETAAVVVGYPSFFGTIEDLRAIQSLAAARGALLVTTTSEPYALSVLEPPGALGADIAVGEGQALAVPAQFGGPGVGLFACKKEHIRQMPGRLVGETVDQNGERGFVLTLSTREQHIRRERATSNICTNHGLIALAMVIRVAMLGRSGFAEAGRQCLSRTEYLKSKLRGVAGLSLPFSAPTFNELVLRFDRRRAADVVDALAKQEILAGVDLGRYEASRASELLVAVTEKHAKADLDRFADALRAAV